MDGWMDVAVEFSINSRLLDIWLNSLWEEEEEEDTLLVTYAL